MDATASTKTMIQCDFDGTITEKDISFLLLDNFTNGDWKPLLEEYRAGKISVGAFNTKSFAMIQADKQTLTEFILTSSKVKIRPGLHELLDYCSSKNLRFVIVSNGLNFYIKAILKNMGINNLEIFAAKNRFLPGRLEAKYIGPDGKRLETSFKETYTKLFLKQGYQVIYVGDGISDIYPAKRAHHIFAIGDLLHHCQEINLRCTPFNDLNDVVKGLEVLPLS